MKYTPPAPSEKTEYELLPEGSYAVTVLSAEETVSKGGKEMVKLEVEVDNHGNRIFAYLVLTENAFWKIDQFRRSIGEEPKEGEEVEIDVSTWEGKSANAQIVVEKWSSDGKEGSSNKVGKWLPRDGGKGDEPF